MKNRARVIALYLPQYHPIPENNEWWEPGFTEWTNVTKAKPLFRNHYQPHLPADLGYYDLRVPETRQAQADMAKHYGIEGFCYWHYWFGGGYQLLERPFNEILAYGQPDYPFCLAWANEDWKGAYHGVSGRKILVEQHYPGEEDYTRHFFHVLPAFKDPRYITVDGKPLFMIYRPLADPQVIFFIQTWRKLAEENGLPGIYFIGHNNEPYRTAQQILTTGVDAVNTAGISRYITQRSPVQKMMGRIKRLLLGLPKTMLISYELASSFFLNADEDKLENVFPTIIPNWDNTPRTIEHGVIFEHSTPDLFYQHVLNALSLIEQKQFEHKIIFLKSWNEWAEGNYMEPDKKWGKAYLEALHKAICG